MAAWSSRIAAVAALLAPAAMVVLAAAALAGEVAIALLAVGLVLAASGAIWFALTARGVSRLAGGKLETWTRMLPDLLGADAEKIDLEFTAPDRSICRDAPLILVSNNPYQLTHLAGAGTRERIDTGTLGVTVARVRSAREVSQLVALELVGQAGRFPGLTSWSIPAFEVRSGGPVEVGLDGEALVLEPPLRFVSMPGALRVRLPRGAGLAPAARAVALTRGNLGELLRVAAGR